MIDRGAVAMEEPEMQLKGKKGGAGPERDGGTRNSGRGGRTEGWKGRRRGGSVRGSD